MKALSLTVLLVALTTAIDPPRKPYPPTGSGTKRLTFNETVVKRAISPSTIFVQWIATADDGDYVYQDDDGSLKIESIVSNQSQTIVPADKVPEDSYSYWINPDRSSVLWATNYTKQYRHSFFADYYVQDVATFESTPLVADQVGDIQYAQWSPTGDAIAFVRGNNLYMWSSDGSSVDAITDDGGPDLFHGVPDWIYEEEILGDRFALWFSPDAEYLAFLSFNETGVPTYTVPYYMDDQEVAPPYPRELEIRYPKVSETNPTVKLSLLRLKDKEVSGVEIDAFDPSELIIGEVVWLTDTHTTVAVKTFNRVQDEQKVVTVDVASAGTKVIQERDGTDGWLDNFLSMAYVGPVGSSKNASSAYYIDLSDHSGWTHLYLFPISGGDPIALTKGNWEVTAIASIDSERQLVYYLSTQHHSTESHLYSVSYRTFEVTPLVDDTVAAYWSASFSSQSGYYILSYLGPDVPYQELYSVQSTDPLRVITSNTAVIDQLKDYDLPKISYFELELPSGERLNVMQRLPVGFNPKKKYPLLFTPYGGPGAQQVSKSWQSLNFNAYISSDRELQYVTWTVDNRGTGGKGRAFRSLVTKQLGLLEAQDQVYAARQAAKHPWIDADHIAIWGWSYGGYLTGKVLETDSDVFTLGLITAPVSDWRFYDSMYTERYMKTLATNAAGYETSAIRETAGFKHVRGGFLIQHGTGDDNVHFQNSAALVDLLVGDGVSPEQMQVQWFTDSDHSINYHGGNLFLYRQLALRLFEEKHREARKDQHQWTPSELSEHDHPAFQWLLVEHKQGTGTKPVQPYKSTLKGLFFSRWFFGFTMSGGLVETKASHSHCNTPGVPGNTDSVQVQLEVQLGDKHPNAMSGRGVSFLSSKSDARVKHVVKYPDLLITGLRIQEVRFDRILVGYYVWSVAQQALAAQINTWTIFVDHGSGQKVDLLRRGGPFASLYHSLLERKAKSDKTFKTSGRGALKASKI